MSSFTDKDDIRKEAKKRLARRLGDSVSPEKEAARERLEARKEAKDGQGASDGGPALQDESKHGYGSDGEALGFERHRLGLLSKLSPSASPRMQALFGIALLLVLVAIGFGIVTCTDRQATSEIAQDGLGAASQQPPASDVDKKTVEVPVPDYLDRDTSDELQSQAQDNPTLARIVGRIDEYGRFGEFYQRKLIELALAEPRAIAFVDKLLTDYPSNVTEEYTRSETQTGIPRLYQWDVRWGLKEYSSAPFGLTGCCPTALSMVYMGLTGKSDMTPGVLADAAREHGYMSESEGTIGSFLIDEAPALGLVCFASAIDADMLRGGLESGYVYICNVGKGDFTEYGHFLVITGLADDGSLVINDPYSSVRSERTWGIDEILNQTIALYAFSAAGA